MSKDKRKPETIIRDLRYKLKQVEDELRRVNSRHSNLKGDCNRLSKHIGVFGCALPASDTAKKAIMLWADELGQAANRW